MNGREDKQHMKPLPRKWTNPSNGSINQSEKLLVFHQNRGCGQKVRGSCLTTTQAQGTVHSVVNFRLTLYPQTVHSNMVTPWSTSVWLYPQTVHSNMVTPWSSSVWLSTHRQSTPTWSLRGQLPSDFLPTDSPLQHGHSVVNFRLTFYPQTVHSNMVTPWSSSVWLSSHRQSTPTWSLRRQLQRQPAQKHYMVIRRGDFRTACYVGSMFWPVDFSHSN